MNRALEAYVSRKIPNIFGEYSLVAVNEGLPGRIRVDFHFKKQDGTDVFIEVSARKIGRTKLGSIIAMYSAIASMEPPLKKFEMIVIGPEVGASAKKELERLPIKVLTYEQVGIIRQKHLEMRGEEWRRQERQQEKVQLAPDEAKLVARWEAEKKTTIRASDVQVALDCTRNYARVLLYNLERKGWVERITRGLYQFIPLSYGFPKKIPPSNAFAIGAALVEPYYFSYYTANSHYGFTTQMPFTIFIATTKKKPEVEWTSSTFKFVTLTERKFFGYRREKVFDREVNMAEPEKSLVDSFDKPRYSGGTEQLVRITWRGLSKINPEKLVDYAIKMRSHALVQRMGFIIDFLAREGLVEPFHPSLRDELLALVGKGAIYLDSRKPKTGRFRKEWRIMNNVPKSQLLSEIEVR